MTVPQTSPVTSFLAVYGSMLASITFGWTMYRDLRDRAKLKVEASIRRIGIAPNGATMSVRPDLEFEGLSDEIFVIVSVVNVGRRPVRWKTLGGKYIKPVNGKTGFVVHTRDLPRTLNEQEAHDEMAEVNPEFLAGNVKQLSIWDVGGNQWNVSRKQLKALTADAKRFWTNVGSAEGA